MQRPDGYICTDCASDHGGMWPPEPYVATWHVDKCNLCGKEKSVCAAYHWRWLRDEDRCRFVTYNGFFIMAGPAPKGVKPERCTEAAEANGFCANHDPEHW